MTIKNAWYTEVGNGLVSISIESANPEAPIHANELTFPSNPTKDNPLRHTINIGVFNEDDIESLAILLDTIITHMRR